MTNAAGDVRRVGRELRPAVARALGRTALSAKRSYLDALGRATHGSRRLSGVGRRGVRLNVRYEYLKSSQGQAVRIRATGPWQLVERDRRGGYLIPAGKGKGRNRRRAHARLRVGDGWTSGPIRGGHARGRHPWARTTPGVLDDAGRIFVDELVRAVRRG